MDRLEVNRRWDKSRRRLPLTNLPQWGRWRITKTLAKWSGQPKKRETQLFWGQAMTVVYPEYVSSKIGRYGYFETDMTSMLIDVLRPGMIVYDVGAHFGYFSMLASELVAAQGHVFALEPTASTYDVLCENASKRENITTHNVAAFRETGEITFRDQGLHDSSLNFIVNDDKAADDTLPGKVINVPAIKLDDFAQQHGDPDFVKIDAEGAEGPILEGMVDVIRRACPGISLEMGDQVCERTGNKPCRENIEFLMDHGYEVFDYRRCKPQRHQTISTYSYDNLFFRHPQWQCEDRHRAVA